MPLGIRSTKFETTGLHAVLFSPLHYALSQVFVVGAAPISTAEQGTLGNISSFNEILHNFYLYA